VRDPGTGCPLSVNQLKAEISVFMAAGFESTSHAITWTLTALAVHPEVQEKVYQELLLLGLAPSATSSDSARIGDAGNGQKNIEAADLGRLPYMQVSR
jgi:cytochrome P450